MGPECSATIQLQCLACHKKGSPTKGWRNQAQVRLMAELAKAAEGAQVPSASPNESCLMPVYPVASSLGTMPCLLMCVLQQQVTCSFCWAVFNLPFLLNMGMVVLPASRIGQPSHSSYTDRQR
eukprot:GHRR01016571.1.p2 GENE.GHRR01016571.1~~GHRR01016571.1.p2  ORF type:complete len:123 (-),score=26.82 GHRR01016571.1:801-1169(-)